MLRVLVLLALLTAGAFGAPLVMEGADTACAALQHRLAGVASPSGLAGPRRVADLKGLADPKGVAARPAGALPAASHAPGEAADGRLAEAMAKRASPALPPVAGCTLAYWLTVVTTASVARHGP